MAEPLHRQAVDQVDEPVLESAIIEPVDQMGDQHGRVQGSARAMLGQEAAAHTGAVLQHEIRKPAARVLVATGGVASVTMRPSSARPAMSASASSSLAPVRLAVTSSPIMNQYHTTRSPAASGTISSRAESDAPSIAGGRGHGLLGEQAAMFLRVDPVAVGDHLRFPGLAELVHADVELDAAVPGTST